MQNIRRVISAKIWTRIDLNSTAFLLTWENAWAILVSLDLTYSTSLSAKVFHESSCDKWRQYQTLIHFSIGILFTNDDCRVLSFYCIYSIIRKAICMPHMLLVIFDLISRRTQCTDGTKKNMPTRIVWRWVGGLPGTMINEALVEGRDRL